VRPGPARLPGRDRLVLTDGVLREAAPGDNSIVLWLPGARSKSFQDWQRVSTLPRGEITVRKGLCAAAALSIPLRQPLRGLLGKVFGSFRKVPEDRAWILPNGQSAERHGERRNDLILVWVQDEAAAIDEAQVRAQWPEGKDVQKIGENLYLVSGIEPAAAPAPEPEVPPQPCPMGAAEQLLAAARARGDRHAEALALTDLGILTYQSGDAQRAAALLGEALVLSREMGDRSAEKDVLGHLGLASFALGQTQRAQEFFQQALRFAREAQDPFAEKMALGQLGLACAGSGDYLGARTCFEQALALARQVGDRKHEGELLWYLSIQHAQLGEREQAIAYGQATVDFLTRLGKPQATWFSHHLERYRNGEAGADLGAASQPAPGSAEDVWAASVAAVSGWGAPGVTPPGPQPAAGNPGLLRMAFSAARSMAKFLGSGLKTVSPTVYQQRQQTCARCEHHTGVRCRLCGCFTNVKARMAHEECPLGKWPA
jgi:tetratricopeptide (TPR) repeat protein